MKQFLQKNQVFLSGILSAIAVSLQQFLGKPSIDYKILGLALAIGVGGYLGNQLRGKGISVAGLLGIGGTTIATIAQTGTITWAQFGISFVAGLLTLVAPPPKSESYEQSATIVTAKEEAKVQDEIKKEA